MSTIQLLVIVLVLGLLLNYGGSTLFPTYGSSPYYGYGYGGVIVLVLILFLLFR